MLALLGLATIAILLTVIMTKWMSPLIALILIPIVAALIGGLAGTPVNLWSPASRAWRRL